MWSHFGRKGLVLGVALGAGLWLLAGTVDARAAQNEVRLPVEKSVRLAPPQEPAAKAADARPEKRPEPVAAPRPEPRAPEAAKPEAARAEASKPEAKKPAAKASNPVAEARPAEPSSAEPKTVAAKPAPKPKPAAPAAGTETAPVAEAAPKPAPKQAPKPRPEPVIDPLAQETPAQPARGTVSLPEGGQFVGEVELEFLADRVILRAAANGPVERVTHFGLTDPSGQRIKLALDMRGEWRKKGATVLRFDTGPVKAVVTGHHPDRLRLAVEFRLGAVAPDMQPVVELGPRGFTATIPLAVRLKP